MAMVVIAASIPFSRVPEDTAKVHTDFESDSMPAPRRVRWVHELTQARYVTLFVAGIAIAIWALLKTIVHQRYGVFALG